ncbi:MAG TPA: hypothetical protein VN893_22195 [Bryobacteraceae bacterium]|nr:hypothetical protein [Bryobacteraceae bacterium]
MIPAQGQGYLADLADLHLEVQWSDDRWHYRIIRPTGNHVLTNWTAPAEPGVYQEPENTKFHAVSDALANLKRESEDVHAVFNALTWRPYGPGH